ncbi:MAG: NAD(P)H-hydrate epimerase, partial [Pseudomonadota bacterium]
MSELLTAAQMRAIEQAAIDSGEVTGLELMERAGKGVVEAIFEEWPDLATTSHRAVILCGPGNNGGDGFVVARLLKEWGWEVEVFLYGDAEKLPPDARVNYERWSEFGEVEEDWPEDDRSDQRLQCADVFIDAMFGTGLRRSLPEAAEVFVELCCSPPDNLRVVSVDLPSGICSDSGKEILPVDSSSLSYAGGSFFSNVTVTFHWSKLGHFLDDGPLRCGRVVVKALWSAHAFGGSVDPGIPPDDQHHMHFWDDLDELDTQVEFRRELVPVEGGSVGKIFSSHKYTHGHALLLAGPPGHGGAARLAARGALRIGAGLVTVGCPDGALAENAARLDAIMCRPIADPTALARTLEDTRLNALCLGPGLGPSETTRTL